MAIITTKPVAGKGIDISGLDISDFFEYKKVSFSATSLKFSDDANNYSLLTGTNFTYTTKSDGSLKAITGGAITGSELKIGGVAVLTAKDLNVSAKTLYTFYVNHDAIGALNYILREADTITGTALKDTLYGAGGDDTIYGGLGNDTILGGSGKDTLKGEIGNDTIDGGSAADRIEGGAGNDTINGGTGNDTIFGGADDDKISGGSGDDVIDAGIGNDMVFGGTGNDRLSGIAGKNQLFGESGDDTLFGGSGDDTLSGGAGKDTLNGNAGKDKLLGGTENDVLNGGSDNDQLFGESGNDTLNGDAGDDTLSGGTGIDSLSGGSGNDKLSGDSGGDSLYGGLGADTLTGGTGEDRFIFKVTQESNDADGRDTITDFNKGNDLIDLSMVDAVSGSGTGKAGLQHFVFKGEKSTIGAAGELTYKFVGSDTLISGNTDPDADAEFSILIKGHIVLDKADFLL
ncbi:calcium-binding protein [Shinella sp.]|uniref:calcium-binding protein n=1 Tax=Shinella sp. TaxID=1870904 RepID=UPI0028B13811|nr:calcium-binding protein [Shinella sp.]